MGVAKINKLELYVHKSVVDSVIASIHDTESCEIISCEEENSTESRGSVKLQELDSFLSEARFLLRFLEPYYNDPISSLDRSMGEKPSISVSELTALSRKTDVISIAEDMRQLERRKVEIRSELTQIDQNLEILKKLEDLEYPLEFVSLGTETTRGMLGTIPVNQLDSWNNTIMDNIGEDAETFIVPANDKDKENWVIVFYFKEKEAQVLEISSKHGMSRVEMPQELKGKVPEEKKRLQAKAEFLQKEEKSIDKKAAKAAKKWVPVFRALSDYWSLLHSREEVLQSGEYTDQVVVLKAWVPVEYSEEVNRELAKYEEFIEVVSREPEPEEEAPTIMRNSKWVYPFESLTRLYGPPKYGSIDPTPLFAPFFFIFFGMCLGDGGYGLITIGFFLYFVRKYKKMPSGMKQFFLLFVLSGIASVVVGALTGSWAGDMIDAFPFLNFLQPLKNMPIVLDPMNDPMTFLAISLVFGVIQIFFGLFVAFYGALRDEDYVGAFGDQGGWLVFLAGLLMLGGAASGTLSSTFMTAGKILSIAGAAILILTQGRDKEGFLNKAASGVLSLYNVTAYLGDVLSYSRLLALGLATSAIAMIINMLSGLVTGIPFVGWVIAIVLFLGGHIFSIAVNVLGAFVHSLRLQYVEFFSKFYSGGGKAFEPLAYNPKYIDVAKSSKN